MRVIDCQGLYRIRRILLSVMFEKIMKLLDVAGCGLRVTRMAMSCLRFPGFFLNELSLSVHKYVFIRCHLQHSHWS